MPKQHLSFLRALRCATIAVFLAASLELFRQIVFSAGSAWPAPAAAILVCASIVSALNLGSFYKTKTRTDQFPEDLIENLPEITCIIGDGGRFKRWNSNFEAAHGYTPQEIAKTTVFDAIAEEHRETAPQTVCCGVKSR